MLYNDVPIGLCAVGLGSGAVLLSGRWVEPVGGVTYRKVIRDWGLQSRLCTPSLLFASCCVVRYFAPLQAPGLHLPASKFTGGPQLWVSHPFGLESLKEVTKSNFVFFISL